MEQFKVRLRSSVDKDLRLLHSSVVPRIIERFQALASNPFPAGTKKLKGSDYFRLRIGDCRIVYTVNPEDREIVIVRVGQRGDVYR